MQQLEGLSHYRVHSLYKGHVPIADKLALSQGVCNSKVPLYSAKLQSRRKCTLICCTLGNFCTHHIESMRLYQNSFA